MPWTTRRSRFRIAGVIATRCGARNPVQLLELPNGGHGLNGYRGPSWDARQQAVLVSRHEVARTPALNSHGGPVREVESGRGQRFAQTGGRIAEDSSRPAVSRPCSTGHGTFREAKKVSTVAARRLNCWSAGAGARNNGGADPPPPRSRSATLKPATTPSSTRDGAAEPIPMFQEPGLRVLRQFGDQAQSDEILGPTVPDGIPCGVGSGQRGRSRAHDHALAVAALPNGVALQQLDAADSDSHHAERFDEGQRQSVERARQFAPARVP